LPSFGLFLAMIGGISEFSRRMEGRSDGGRYRSLLKIGLGAFVVLLAFATWARANVWSSWPALAEQGVRQHPQSMRARLDQISLLLAQSKGEEALKAYRGLATLSNPAAANVSAMGTVYLQCRMHDRTTPEDVAAIARMIGQNLQLPDLMSAENLANQLIRRDCAGLGKDELARILSSAVDASGQSAQRTQIWRTRFVAARLFLDAREPRLAQEQAALAW